MSEPAQPETNPPPEPSWGGCVVPGVVALLFLGLGTCTVMTGYLQSKGLAKFTEAAALTFEPLQPSAAAIAQAQGALEKIQRAAKEGTEAEVVLTMDDLNTLIATAAVLESYRTSARVRAITPRALEVEMSQELRGKRFLNGRFSFTPARSETNTWQLMLEAIDVPDRVVPGPFVQTYRNLHMFRFDADIPELQAVLKRIDGMRLEEGHIIISVPAKAPEL